MKKQIKRFSIHQTSKVIALFQFIVTAIIMIPIGILRLFSEVRGEAFIYFVMPFIYWAVTYVIFVGVTWIYNLVASSFGGIEFNLEDK